MYKKSLLLSIVLFLFSTLIFANQLPSDTLTVYKLDPVVVTGSRISISKSSLPSSVSIVSNRLIQEQNHVPLLDLVSQNVPNLFVTQRSNIGYGVASGAGGNISIRGVGGSPTSQVLVLIDGRPDIMGLFGHPLGDAYFMHDVQRIEVLRGPASLLYGSNAMGGAINIITSHDHKEGFHIEVPLRYGSFNTKNTYFRQTYGGDNWGYSLSGGYRDSEGYREKGDDSYSSKSGNLEFNWEPVNNLKIYGNSYFSDMDINDPGQISNPFYNHWFDLQRFGGDITIEHQYNNFTSKIKIHHNYGHHEIHDANDNAGEDANYISDDQTTGLIATETWQYQEKSHLTIGFDFRNYGGQAEFAGLDKDHSINEYSGMFVVNHIFFNKVVANAGFRYTDHSVAGPEVIPSAGVSYLLPNQWTIKGEYAKGYRNPSIKDLYLFKWPNGMGPSNQDLKPEISHSYELSLKKNYYDVFTNSITAFHNDLDNLIRVHNYAFRNVGIASITGLEIEGQLLLPPDLAFNWAASFSNFSTKKITGSPETKLDLSMRYRALKGLYLTLQGQYINGLYSPDNPYNTTAYVELDDYLLVNFTSNYDFSTTLSFFAKIKNILDQDYQTMAGYPLPGLTYTFGLTLKY